MKRSAAIFALTVTILLYGCGGVPGSTPTISTSPTAAPAAPATPPTPNVIGNWQFNAVSAVPGTPSFSFGGSISQTDHGATTALHVDGSKCFNRLTTLGLTGPVTGDSISLTSTAIEGQVVTFTGAFTSLTSATFNVATFSGTYSIDGGCASGDHGTITGFSIPYIANVLSGTFTNSAQQAFNVTGDIGQSGGPSSVGSSELSGGVSFDTPCLNAATIKPGAFPSGSYILGTLVAFEFDTNDTTLTFLGTLSPDRSQINGSYSVSGGCNDSGTAVLHVTSPWDY
jgi:hypothetical protein